MKRWRIVFTTTARRQLAAIKDRRVQRVIARAIDRLASDPERHGKALIGELSGYRSVRAAGQRYRIIYRVEAGTVTVFIVALGIRKEGDSTDVYALAQRLLRRGVLSPEESQAANGEEAPANDPSTNR